MRKIISHIKQHKKAYLLGTVGVVAVIGLGIALSWNCIQFNHYCKEKELCACANQKLSKQEKKAFIALATYMKKTGKQTVDAGILKYTTADALAEVGLKMKSCSADIARQAMLDNNAANREKFPGDYNCMRQALMNELSNEEVLFLQSPQSKSMQALQNPTVLDMYIVSSSKIMKCMNDQIQKKYLEEVKKLKMPEAPKKKRKKVEVKPVEANPET